MDGIEGLCARLTGKALQSPYRSTVPLLDLIEHNRAGWNELLKSWEAPIGSTVHFEYRVPSPKQGGNPSQTDVLLMSDTKVWAVEAKWTEPQYETVAKRIAKPESDGADPKETVMGWLNYIQPFSERDLRLDDFEDVVYQALHRAASACWVATERQLRPELVYLHFHPSNLRISATTEQYVEVLRQLHELLGSPSALKISVVEIPIKPTTAFEAIKDLDKTAKASATKVKEALCREPLFTFGQPITTKI